MPLTLYARVRSNCLSARALIWGDLVRSLRAWWWPRRSALRIRRVKRRWAAEMERS